MATPDVSLEADRNYQKQLLEVDGYLTRSWPGAHDDVMRRLEGSLGIKVTDFLKQQAVQSPFSLPASALGMSFGLPVLVAKAVGSLGLWATGKALFYCYDDLYQGYNPYKPDYQPELFVNFLLWTWGKNGKPSYLFLHNPYPQPAK